MKRVPSVVTFFLAYKNSVTGKMNRINVPQMPPVYVTITYGFLVKHTIIIAGMLKIIDHTPFTSYRLSWAKNRQHALSYRDSHDLIGKTCIKLFLKLIIRIGTAAVLSMG